MPKASGATNRSRQRQAEAERNQEADSETLRLSNLSPEEAAQLGQIYDWIEWGLLGAIGDHDGEGNQEEAPG